MALRILFVVLFYFVTAALIYSHAADSKAIIAANLTIVLGVFVLWVYYYYKRNEKVRDFIDELF